MQDYKYNRQTVIRVVLGAGALVIVIFSFASICGSKQPVVANLAIAPQEPCPEVQVPACPQQDSRPQDPRQQDPSPQDLGPPDPRDRDIIYQERWPEREQNDGQGPASVLPTVHYLWCRKEKFQFRHYLTLLSVLRVLHPTKIVFHYMDMPLTDTYNTWFDELKTSVFNLELRQIPEPGCSAANILNTTLSFFDLQFGGFFVGSEVILARPPTFQGDDKVWFAAAGQGQTDTSKVIMAVKAGLPQDTLMDSIKKALSSGSSTPQCVGPDQFIDSSDCVAMDTRNLHPRDIMTASSPFAELARWLFYGKRAPQVARRNPNNPIPRISHYIKLQKAADVFKALYGPRDLSFSHYLSILSALYVAGFQQVYFHAEEEPTGNWWEELKQKENVTFVRMDPPSSVYQQRVNVVQHTADLERYLLLEKYGGVYQDLDVIWASHLPDSLLQLPAVMGLDWVKQQESPELANAGLIMVSRGSSWLRRLMKTHRDYRDGDWNFNSGLMPYRVYELYPDSVVFDPHLQVICFSPSNFPPIRCHPTWEENYARSQIDVSPTLKITDWEKDVRAFHITQPKPHPNLSSPEALAKAVAEKKGFFYQIGYKVLEKSGRLHLLKL